MDNKFIFSKKIEKDFFKPLNYTKKRKCPWISIIILLIIIFGVVFIPMIWNKNCTEFYVSDVNVPPQKGYLFGTDSLGRDVFAIIWEGGRVSLFIGIVSASISGIIGVFLGSISALSKNALDMVIMKAVEMGTTLPKILLILIIVSLLGSHGILSISFVIALTSWFIPAKIVRDEVRKIRNNEFVLEAKLSKAGLIYIIRRHLLPNFLSSIMFVIISTIGTAISLEATLSFLGLGLPPEIISWGTMLSLANNSILLNSWWTIVIPGIFLLVTLLSITKIAYYFKKEVNRKERII